MIELFRLSRDYDGLVGGINIKKNYYIINNVDLPCAVVNNVYIDDKHLPVERVSVLIVADNCDNDVIVTINTNGDWKIILM